MKVSVLVIGLLAASVMGQPLAQDEPSANEAQDHATYFTSLSAPVMGKLCAPLMPDYAIRLEALFPAWRARNRDAIERGKQVEIAHLWPGKTIADFEGLAFETIRDKFNAAPREQQRQRCQGVLNIMSRGAGAVAASPAPALAGDAVARLEKADRLVTLVGSLEQEALAIRFMIKGSPLTMPDGMSDCMVREARPAMQSYLADLYGRSMTLGELDQALEFFGSATGQAVVNIRAKHLRDLFAAAEKLEHVASERPVYPANVQAEWEAFEKTPAGRFFVDDDDVTARSEVRTQISELRSQAFAKCLRGS
jgi:hypothetical protein